MTYDEQQYQNFIQKLFRAGKELDDLFQKLSPENKLRLEHNFPAIFVALVNLPKS